MGKSLEERFWSRVNTAGKCWMWEGAYRGANNYGVMSHYGVRYTAHRLAWEFVNGPIPEGMNVCHTCDRPRCVNPDHLFLGTPATNAADRNAKGRQARGEKHGRAKLTWGEVEEIRERYATTKTTHRQLAHEYGVSPTSIGCILRFEKWT